ncbi:MAG: DUF2752 domain-containing protein [Ruminococcus sp.]|nr:DUF2752 domain-containing protein [Ruminococcus sp.]
MDLYFVHMKKYVSGALAISMPLAAVMLFFTRGFWISISEKFPTCTFHAVTGGYCPGCGNTRSVIALLHGDIIGSLRNNIAPLFLLILLLMVYIEFLLNLFGKSKKIIPRNAVFWCVTGICIFVYYIIRNFVGVIAPM